MATDYNHIEIFGKCTRDPELTFRPDKRAVCSCGIASNEEWKDPFTGKWMQDPDFFEFNIYGRSGEAFAKYHSTGDKIFLEGRLKRQFRGKVLQPVIRVASWQFCGGNHPQRPKPEASLERHVVEQEGPF